MGTDVSIIKTINEQLKSTEEQQTKAMDNFVKDSVSVKQSLQGVEKKNSKKQASIQRGIEKIESSGSGDTELGDFLSDCTPFVEQMKDVSIEFSSDYLKNAKKRINEFMNKAQATTKKIMKSREEE